MAVPFGSLASPMDPGQRRRQSGCPSSVPSALFGPEKGAQLLVAHLQPSADPIRLEAGPGGRAPLDRRRLRCLLRRRPAARVWRGAERSSFTVGPDGGHRHRRRHPWIAQPGVAWRRRRGNACSVSFGQSDSTAEPSDGTSYFGRAVISVAAYLLALAVAILFIRLGTGWATSTIGGTQTDLSLSPSDGRAGAASRVRREPYGDVAVGARQSCVPPRHPCWGEGRGAASYERGRLAGAPRPLRPPAASRWRWGSCSPSPSRLSWRWALTDRRS